VRHFRGRARCFRGEKERRVRLSDGNEREWARVLHLYTVSSYRASFGLPGPWQY
jgi:hypothetical protein